MPFILPELAQTGPDYDGSKPLPRRFERVARLVVENSCTNDEAAARCGLSLSSLKRVKRHDAFLARLAYLRRRAATQALAEEPLAEKGQRVALLGSMVRRMRADLDANNWETTLGVSKQGNPITGFDRARVSEIRQYVARMQDEVEPRTSTIVEGTTIGVSVAMTTADAVTRVQALLSRTQTDVYKEGDPPAGAPEQR